MKLDLYENGNKGSDGDFTHGIKPTGVSNIIGLRRMFRCFAINLLKPGI